MRVFTVAFPPSTNTAYVNGRKGRHLSKKARAYKDRATLVFRGNIPTDDFYCVSIHLHPPTLTKRDCGNYEKLITDCMTGHIYNDDSQIKELHIFMHHKDGSDPRAEIEVSKIKW